MGSGQQGWPAGTRWPPGQSPCQVLLQGGGSKEGKQVSRRKHIIQAQHVCAPQCVMLRAGEQQAAAEPLTVPAPGSTYTVLRTP